MNISDMSDPTIRPMSTADRHAIAKTAWNATIAWVKNTGDSSPFDRPWDALVKKGHDQILMLTVMDIHRAIAISNDAPSIGNVWHMGYDEKRSMQDMFPHAEAPVAEVFVRVATTLVLLWIKNAEEGFYVITRGAPKSMAPAPYERSCSVTADDGTTCELEDGHSGAGLHTRGNYVWVGTDPPAGGRPSSPAIDLSVKANLRSAEKTRDVTPSIQDLVKELEDGESDVGSKTGTRTKRHKRSGVDRSID